MKKGQTQTARQYSFRTGFDAEVVLTRALKDKGWTIAKTLNHAIIHGFPEYCGKREGSPCSPTLKQQKN